MQLCWVDVIWMPHLATGELCSNTLWTQLNAIEAADWPASYDNQINRPNHYLSVFLQHGHLCPNTILTQLNILLFRYSSPWTSHHMGITVLSMQRGLLLRCCF